MVEDRKCTDYENWYGTFSAAIQACQENEECHGIFERKVCVRATSRCFGDCKSQENIVHSMSGSTTYKKNGINSSNE